MPISSQPTRIGLGSETCTTSCCGSDVTMNETSRSQNHKFLYGTNSLYIVFSLVILGVGANTEGKTEIMQLFPFSKDVIIGLIALGTFTFAAGVMGILGTWYRNRGLLVVWIFLTVILTIAEIIAAAVLQTNVSEEEFEKYTDTQFIENWKDLVEEAETNSDTLEWVKEVQVEGVCCGWKDASDATENPAYLECDESYEVVCSDYFKENFSAQFGSLSDVSLGLSIVQLILMISTFALICRLKEFYKSENIDFGDYVHVPFGKARNLQDLGAL